jgi:4-alpha-glucanotransferase
LPSIPNVLNRRRAGVLLHITSLPGSDLGQDAFKFVDFLARVGASVWQTLPLNQPHGEGSPYQCLSAYAGNPNLISLETLRKQGLLEESDLSSTLNREDLIQKAYANFKQLNIPKAHYDFIGFCERECHWLDDFSLFMALREQYQSSCWRDWPLEIKLREKDAVGQAHIDYADKVSLIKFTQYLFFQQWHALKEYANNQSIVLFGDIPIFISYDSADVWAQPDLFKLDCDLNMTVVAGVPPDYFSETGQRWGNPHYRWDVMQTDGFQWWLARMRTQNALFDMVRIDHFRGLEAAWEIPENEPTAIKGSWVKAPGEALLNEIKNHLPSVTLVAEDLGIITSEVNVLRDAFNLPGMKILQFAFDGSSDNPYLPERIPENSVVYTGTHDNDTTLGWFLNLTDDQKQPFYNYMQAHFNIDKNQIQMPTEIINLALASKACLAIIPMQDILHLDSASRMNIPGTIENNWQWKFEWWQLRSEMESAFTEAIERYHRNPLFKVAT